jgi:hypothetical protein
VALMTGLRRVCQVSEGFAEVVKVPFRVDRNVAEADRALLRSYL